MRLDPSDIERLKQSSRLYRMAGAPVKAARAFRKTLGPHPAPADWDHVVNIHLSGGRHALAREALRNLAYMEKMEKLMPE